MVTPYLSRLRPAEAGPLLRPRPRSRFEPAPVLPIDGLAIGSLGLSLPAAGDAEGADVETELDRDPPPPHPASPAAAAATPGDQGPPAARTAVPEQAAPDEERAPALAARAARSPRREPPPTIPPAGDIKPDQNLPSPHLAGPAVAAATPGDQGPPPARTAVPEQAPQPGPAPAAAYASERGYQTPASAEADFRPTPAEAAGREHAPAPWSTIRRIAPQPRHAPPGQAPVLSAGPGRSGAEPTPPEAAPAESPPPVPHRQVDQASRSADADRVQAMARWLSNEDAAAARAEPTTRPSMGANAEPPGRAWDWRGPAADTEVTVTIGRIEVKAPAADPAPARSQPSGPRRRVPSLSDYLESRTRARGRPG